VRDGLVDGEEIGLRKTDERMLLSVRARVWLIGCRKRRRRFD